MVALTDGLSNYGGNHGRTWYGMAGKRTPLHLAKNKINHRTRLNYKEQNLSSQKKFCKL